MRVAASAWLMPCNFIFSLMRLAIRALSSSSSELGRPRSAKIFPLERVMRVSVISGYLVWGCSACLRDRVGSGIVVFCLFQSAVDQFPIRLWHGDTLLRL